jgi:hypothetical protein
MGSGGKLDGRHTLRDGGATRRRWGLGVGLHAADDYGSCKAERRSDEDEDLMMLDRRLDQKS